MCDKKSSVENITRTNASSFVYGHQLMKVHDRLGELGLTTSRHAFAIGAEQVRTTFTIASGAAGKLLAWRQR